MGRPKGSGCPFHRSSPHAIPSAADTGRGTGAAWKDWTMGNQKPGCGPKGPQTEQFEARKKAGGSWLSRCLLSIPVDASLFNRNPSLSVFASLLGGGESGHQEDPECLGIRTDFSRSRKPWKVAIPGVCVLPGSSDHSGLVR